LGGNGIWLEGLRDLFSAKTPPLFSQLNRWLIKKSISYSQYIKDISNIFHLNFPSQVGEAGVSGVWVDFGGGDVG
jgi:hypothetical protein